jgi:hypothetical protein
LIHETQFFNDLDMVLELECLSSFLAANNARKILRNNHLVKKLAHWMEFCEAPIVGVL